MVVLAMLQATQAPQFIMPTTTEIIMGLGTLFSMGLNYRFAASVAGMKLEIKAESDRLRDDLLRRLDGLRNEFVPSKFDDERRNSERSRVEKLESEIEKNRDRIHEMSNQLQTLMLGPLNQIQTQLTDKARRMATYEAERRALDDQLRDIEERISDLEHK
jgi:chromosome segregation ATPase